MSAPTSRVHATVSTPSETFDGVSVLKPAGSNTVVLRRRQEPVAQRADVTSVQFSGGEWTLTFADGEVWKVVDTPYANPCGCD